LTRSEGLRGIRPGAQLQAPLDADRPHRRGELLTVRAERLARLLAQLGGRLLPEVGQGLGGALVELGEAEVFRLADRQRLARHGGRLPQAKSL
jgi:hypothetical protein